MRPTEQQSLHFNLGYLPDVPYVFCCAGRSAALQRHTPETLLAAREAQPILRAFPDASISHFVDAVLPSDAVALMTVTTPQTIGTTTVDAPVHLGVHLPEANREAARAQAVAVPGPVHPKLVFNSISAEQFTAAVASDDAAASNAHLPQFPQSIHVFQDATDAATAFLFCHHDLMNLNLTTGSHIVTTAITKAIGGTSNELPSQINSDARHGRPWMVTTVAPDGSVHHSPSADVVAHMAGSVQQAVQYVKNDQQLEGQQWNVTPGTTSSAYSASSSVAAVTPAPAATPQGDGGGTGNLWAIRNLTPGNGLTVSFDGYTPPTSTDSWVANGVWSMNDTPSLTSEIAADLLAGNITVTISTPTGTISSATLVAGTQTSGQATPFTATFNGGGTVSGTFSLNAGQSGLAYTLNASGIGGSAGTQLMNGATSIYEIPLGNTTGMGTIAASCTNSWLRHLSLYVQFLDAGKNPITPPADYPELLPGFLRGGGTNPDFEPNATKRFLAVIPPASTFFGVLIPANATPLSISVPNGVSTVRLLFGGLGRGSFDSDVCALGIVMTAFAELALPMLMFTTGSAEENNAPVKSILSDPEVMFALCVAGGVLFAGGAAAYVALSDDPGEALESLATKFGPMLLKKGLSSLAKWYLTQEGIAASEDVIPFVDIAFDVLRCVTTAAELAQTTIAILDSPYVFETDFVQTMNLTVTLGPDPRYNQFPDLASTLNIVIAYDCGTTVATQEFGLTQPLPSSIPLTFYGVPAGGNFQVFAFFYAANGWQSGQGQSGWLPAETSDGTFSISLTITDNLVPLDITSVYQHSAKIGIVNNQLGWIDTSTPPIATAATASPFGPTISITKLVDITVAQKPQMVGYAWEASGLDGSSNDQFTVQTLSLGPLPTVGLAVPASDFSGQSGITFDMTSPDNGQGRNFYIDPSVGVYDVNDNPDGGYHLRQLALQDSTAPNMAAGDQQLSWGRFLLAIDRYVVHPQGYVFGITASPDKIYRITLPQSPVPDGQAPMATLMSGSGTRLGLIAGAAGIAVALDARIVIAEENNYRLQAFDVNGNPVPYFAGGTSPTAPLQNSAGDTILDLAIEGRGYIYVLYLQSGGTTAAQYFLDIYDPTGNFLVQTPAVAAGCISVDLLRALFTLNYETIVDQNNRVQPTISKWLPTPPQPGSAS
jgi:hypothetical protein